MFRFQKRRETKVSLLFRLISLLKTVAAGAVFAVAGVAYVNGVQFAVHAVAIVLAFGHSA